MAERTEGNNNVATKHRLGTGFRLALLALTALILGACTGRLVELHREMDHKHWQSAPTAIAIAPTHTPTALAEAPAAPEPQADTATPQPEPTETPTDSPAATATSAAAQQSEQTTQGEQADASQATATATATRPRATATRARPTATATPRPTPIVVIPNGFTKQVDSVRGYSLALPRGYALIDLRSAQFRNLAGTLGMGDQMAALNQYLDSPAGQAVGILAASDLTGMIFGGLPTIAQVMVVDAKGASQDTAQVSIEQLISGPGGLLTNAVIETLENATINNLPGVRATVQGTLTGSTRATAGKVVGLLANDKFYVLLQLTGTNQLSAKEPIFDQIIGTFRPE